MLDQMILTVSDVERSLAFYEAALKPLNIKFFMPYKGEDGHPDLWGFGDGKRAFFWIKQGKPDPAAIHWGFKAEDERKVDEFYEAAMSSGARDNISPRARETSQTHPDVEQRWPESGEDQIAASVRLERPTGLPVLSRGWRTV